MATVPPGGVANTEGVAREAWRTRLRLSHRSEAAITHQQITATAVRNDLDVRERVRALGAAHRPAHRLPFRDEGELKQGTRVHRCVDASAAVERVIAGAADERVVAAEAGEDVVAAVAGDDVVAVVPGAIGVVVDRGGQVIDVEALVLPAEAVMRLAGIAGAEQHAVSQICGSVGAMILVGSEIRTEVPVVLERRG